MAESEASQMTVTQVVIQAAMAVVMAMRKADTRSSYGAKTANSGEEHRQRHGGPKLRKTSFNRNATH